MRGFISFLLSILAIVVSSFTTYIQFLNERYTLSASIVDVNASVQRGSFSSGGTSTVTFRYFLEPAIILSNRGTRSLVITGARLVRSEDPEQCALGEDVYAPYAAPETTVLQSDTVEMLQYSFGLENIEVDYTRGFSLENFTTLWCLQVTAFDHRGRRLEPLFTLADIETRFAGPSAEDDTPRSGLAVDFPKGPARIASSGFFAG